MANLSRNRTKVKERRLLLKEGKVKTRAKAKALARLMWEGRLPRGRGEKDRGPGGLALLAGFLSKRRPNEARECKLQSLPLTDGKRLPASNDVLSKATRNPLARRALVSWPLRPLKLFEPSWPKDAIAQVDAVTKDLEAGQFPKGSVALCGSLAQAENLRRLAALQQCNSCKFALVVVSKKQKEVPSGALKVLLPFWDSGQVVLSETFVFPLGQELPSTLPKQVVRTTKVAAEVQGLAVFRVLAPEALLPKESWQAAKKSQASP